MEQNNQKQQQLALARQMVEQRSWTKTPFSYTRLGAGLTLLQQQALLLVSDHLQPYIKRFYELKMDRQRETPKSLFTDAVLREGIPPFRIYLQDLGVLPSNYEAARKAIDEINLQVEHQTVDPASGKLVTVLTNVFSQFGFETSGDFYHYTDAQGNQQATARQQPYIDVKINPDVAAWAFDMASGYVNHLKLIALYSTKRPTPRVYMLLMRALKKDDVRTDLRVPFDELKEYLGIVPYKDKRTGEFVTPYPMFSNFKQKVLDAVRDDLLRMARQVPPTTDITFTYEPVYPGRRRKGDPEAILFHIERTSLGLAYGVVVSHARLPLEPDLFAADPQQQPFRDAFRQAVAAMTADAQRPDTRRVLAGLRFERYDDKLRDLLIQIEKRDDYDLLESPQVRPWFFGRLKQAFPELETLRYRLPK